MSFETVKIGPHTLIHGDCLDVLPTLSGVNCVVTSPPYNQLGSRMFERGGMHAETRWASNTEAVGYADDMPEDKYQAWLTAVLESCSAASRPGASIFVNHKCRWRDCVLLHPAQWLSVAKARLRQEIIWRRAGSTTLNARMFGPNEERILWFVVDGAKWKWNQPATSFLSVWDITQDNDANGHPCPYPLSIPYRCITATTDDSDVVLDPFLGSGTTVVACHHAGRIGIGIEKERRFFDMACKRIEDAVNAEPLWIQAVAAIVQPALFEESAA